MTPRKYVLYLKCPETHSRHFIKTRQKGNLFVEHTSATSPLSQVRFETDSLGVKSMSHATMASDYCLGFAIYGERVLLVKKNHPTWQAGRFNGIGGKRDPKETFLESMVREFKEETGIDTQKHEWKRLCYLHRENHFRMQVFFRRGVFVNFKEVNDVGETNHEFSIDEIMRMEHSQILLNVKWMLALTMDLATDAGQLGVDVSYGEHSKDCD